MTTDEHSRPAAASPATLTRATRPQWTIPGGRRTAAALAVAGVAAVTVAAALDPEAVSHGPELCPFRRMTGLPCPGCGLTRSWVALAHGDVSGAFAFNLLGPMLFGLLLLVTVAASWSSITGNLRPLERIRRVVVSRYGLAVLVLWLAYGVIRAVDAGCGWGVFPTIT